MSIWPGAIASDANLYIEVDFPNSVTALNGTINSSVTSINVTNASNYPTSGGFILIDSELIYFAGISGNTLTGCLRGQDGTLPATHLNNALVNMVIMAEHHNVLKNEIIAIETSLVLTPSTAVATNGSGLIVSSSTTSTELGYVHGVTSAIQTQLNTKIDTAGTGLSKSGTTLNLTTPVSVVNGGTGQTSYTDGQLLIGNSSGNTLAVSTLSGTSNQVTVTNGHGSITLSTPLTSSISYTLPATRGTSGYFLQTDGSTANLVWAAASGGGGVTSITGTTNEVIASASTGAVTLSLPQAIATTSSVQFANVLCESVDASVACLDSSGFGEVIMTAQGTLPLIEFLPGGASFGFFIQATNTGLSGNRFYTLADVGVNGNFVIDAGTQTIGGGKTFSSTVSAPAIDLTNTTNQLVLGTTHTTTISSVAPSASRTYTIPDALAAANFVLSVPYVSLTGQTSSISTTTLFTPTATGTYRISIYVVDTAGTTFTLQGTIGWTDAAQAQTATTSTLTNTTNGYLQSSFFIEAVSGNAVTYAVVLTGTATYNVYVVAERLS